MSVLVNQDLTRLNCLVARISANQCSTERLVQFLLAKLLVKKSVRGY